MVGWSKSVVRFFLEVNQLLLFFSFSSFFLSFFLSSSFFKGNFEE